MSTGIKVVLGVTGGALLVLVLFGLFGGGGFFGPGPMMGQGGMMGGWGPGGMMGPGGWGAWSILGMLIPLLFWGGLIVLIVWVVLHLTAGRHGERPPGTQEHSAQEILRQRYARGEIDSKEYEERRRTLLGGGDDAP